MEEERYVHYVSGEEDSAEGWIASYSEEETELRGLSAEECFNDDCEKDFFFLVD